LLALLARFTFTLRITRDAVRAGRIDLAGIGDVRRIDRVVDRI
jgi:hypothetical protein